VNTDRDREWYKDAIIYELRVSSFFDANQDGIGDFQGLEEKLDYLQDLGVTALWLLPFYPSPLRDDGYDIADYTNVHPDIGSLEDFRSFLSAAHRRGLKVITELVINHTSDQHPWFQRARRAPPGSPERDFYVWSDTPQRFKEARIIFKDFEASNWTWDAQAKAYYWHRFYSHQPDLNFDNPKVVEAILQVLNFWLGVGVDGLRLDAIPYLFERDGTSCENLDETHQLIRHIRAQVDAHYQDRMLLAEANQWPEDAAAYFGTGDECHMAFHFPIMPRLFMALQMEDRFPLVDILEQTPHIPDQCQWALFLRNHDELTLEMVSEEEREYMWRTYARDPAARINMGIRRRLAPLLGGNRSRIELLTALLLSLPGTPVLYYGDEIAMGDNVYLGDRDGVRTPMQWSPDRNAGFSRVNPQRVVLPVVIDPEYHYEAVNVETQQGNPESLLWWMKRLIALRKQFRAFGRGELTMLAPRNPRVLAFIRVHGDESILVVANLSRFVQHVELDLRQFRGVRPLELFGLSRLPPIRLRPYPLTIGPHSYYWLRLSEPAGAPSAEHAPDYDWPVLRVDSEWTELLAKRRASLEGLLPGFVRRQRWFGGKGREIARVNVSAAYRLPESAQGITLLTIDVDYGTESPDRYLLPLGLASGVGGEVLASTHPEGIIADVVAGEDHLGLLHDASTDRDFALTLFGLMAQDSRAITANCRLQGASYQALELRSESDQPVEVRPLGLQQSNTSIRIGQEYVLKLLRRAEPGVNPDLELGHFLTQRVGFRHTPATLGSISLECQGARQSTTICTLQRFVPNVGDAWSYTQGEVARFYQSVLADPPPDDGIGPAQRGILSLIDEPLPAALENLLGAYLDSVQLLGERSAEMHHALSSESEDPRYAPEPFNSLYQRSLYQSLRSATGRTFDRLKESLGSLPPKLRQRTQALSRRESEVLDRYRRIRDERVTALRIRVHGDYHLGQVLCTGNDFLIIDFEGEPARSLSERLIKRSPLRDVAGMLRSFHYAAMGALVREVPGGIVRPADRVALEPWARLWTQWTSARFLSGYLKYSANSNHLGQSMGEIEMLLGTFLLEKAIYEIGYELGHRPDWLAIPLDAVERLLSKNKTHG